MLLWDSWKIGPQFRQQELVETAIPVKPCLCIACCAFGSVLRKQ
jgi:hypothetical protein